MDKKIDFENDVICYVSHFGNDMRTRYIIDGFYEAAELLYKEIESKYKIGFYSDELIYPLCHSIRHTYELSLKDTLEKIKFFIDNYKSCIDFDSNNYQSIHHTHNLKDLYNFIYQYIFQIDSRMLMLKETWEKVDYILDDFIYDEKSDAYRYSTDVDGNENLSDIEYLSINKIFENLKQYRNIISLVTTKLVNLINEYSLGTYYKMLSRHDLYNIALDLPDYKQWLCICFKTKIKNKYKISYRTLNAAIKIIQNSSWLSYFIKYKRPNFEFEKTLIKKTITFSNSLTEDLTEVSLTSNSIKKSLDSVRNKQKFVDLLSDKEIKMLFTYYRMGHEMFLPEQYDRMIEETEEILGSKISFENKSYFRSKISSHNFIYMLMHGFISSGHYELFIYAYDYISNNNINFDLCDFEESYNFYKNN